MQVRKRSLFVGSVGLCIALALCLNSCRLPDETTKLDDFSPKENTVRLCTDGIDNDGNGLVDCQDSGCLEIGTDTAPGPGKIVCPHVVGADGQIKFLENNIYTCGDGKDNDGNGFTDCEDNNCKSNAACCATPNATETGEDACSDGVDNNCNGYIDCGDRSCWFKGAGAEVCRKIKCPNGPSPENTEEACSDGIDNDCNGYIDCIDRVCEPTQYCKRMLSGADSVESSCNDGYDNDLNGFVDCDDAHCKGDPHCVDLKKEPPARPHDFAKLGENERRAILIEEKLLCSDGIDNDKNGKIDCKEYDCHLLSLTKLEGNEAIHQIECP